MKQIDPDEIFLDASNLPHFNVHHFEGRLEQPIKKTAFYLLGLFFAFSLLFFAGKLFELQWRRGSALAERSANNTLRQTPIFAERGLIKDRNGVELAWNEPATAVDRPTRRYSSIPGFAHLLGYISYPTETELATQKYDPKEWIGRDGLEQALDQTLAGQSGLRIEELDVKRDIVSEHLWREPVHGEHVTLAVDSRLQSQLYNAISAQVEEGRFTGGAGVVMDIATGELLALVSAPEFDPNILVAGDNQEQIAAYLADDRQPFLNRALEGLFTPGSIVKPVMALGALNEGVVRPERVIHSSGEIRLPNPYVPGSYSIFRDWKAHGDVDLRRAIAVSSDVYFYAIGGGFADQPGMGIETINRYAHWFGLDQPTGIKFFSEAVGRVPSPEWKARVFDGDVWRVGDTYNTVIGQYGFQVTPLAMARAMAAIANKGFLIEPTVLKDQSPSPTTAIAEIKPEYYQVVKEGMRLAVTEGTAAAVNLPSVAVAAKSGTAELGKNKEFINSWLTGFFPYDRPRYAFAVVMEQGPRGTLVGAGAVMRQVLDWLAAEAPEYLAS